MTVNTEYKVLARKYRPQTFGDLIGQETLVQIWNSFRKDSFSDYYGNNIFFSCNTYRFYNEDFR